MPIRSIYSLRYLAASLITGSGAAHIASLWFRELDAQAVASLLQGAVYLIIGLGLFGGSRFTLFVAIGVPAMVTLGTLGSDEALGGPQLAGITADLLAIILCTIVLWQLSRGADR